MNFIRLLTLQCLNLKRKVIFYKRPVTPQNPSATFLHHPGYLPFMEYLRQKQTKTKIAYGNRYARVHRSDHMINDSRRVLDEYIHSASPEGMSECQFACYSRYRSWSAAPYALMIRSICSYGSSPTALMRSVQEAVGNVQLLLLLLWIPSEPSEHISLYRVGECNSNEISVNRRHALFGFAAYIQPVSQRQHHARYSKGNEHSTASNETGERRTLYKAWYRWIAGNRNRAAATLALAVGSLLTRFPDPITHVQVQAQ